MRRWRDRRLHQVLFAWLALSILAAVAVSGLVLGLLVEPDRAPFGKHVDMVTSFASRQFAARWSDERARADLARDIAETFGAQLTLSGADGQRLLVVGDETCHGQSFGLDVARGTELLGRVD